MGLLTRAQDPATRNPALANLALQRRARSRSGSVGTPDSAPVSESNPPHLQTEPCKLARSAPAIDKSLHGIPPVSNNRPVDPPTFRGPDAGEQAQSPGSGLSRWYRVIGTRLGIWKKPVDPKPIPDVCEEPATEVITSAQPAPDFRRDTRQGKTYSVSQAPPPAKKAFLVTANSAHGADLLDATTKDSTRVQACLKKVGFEVGDIVVLQGADGQSITERSFTVGLDRLFTEANDGDVLVLFISTHAFKSNGMAYLRLEREDKSIACVGASQLIMQINSRLGHVRCTVEVILDVCHAAGLFKHLHVVCDMEPSDNTVVIASAAAETPALSVLSQPLLSDPDGDLSVSAPGASECAFMLPTRPMGHINHAVASGSAVPGSSSIRPITSKLRGGHILGTVAQGMPFVPRLQTKSVVIVWVAAKEDQNAYECTDDLGRTNGALTTAICRAIEMGESLAREVIFGRYVVPILTQLNETPDYDATGIQLEASLQHPQILSNCDEVMQIRDGRIFEGLPSLIGMVNQTLTLAQET